MAKKKRKKKEQKKKRPKLKIKKGDMVQVISGRHQDKGKVGRVLKVIPEEMRVIVEGVNIRKRHRRPSPQFPEGGIIEQEMPIHYSNVMLVDSEGRPTRVGYKIVETEDGKKKKIRIAKTTGEEI